MESNMTKKFNENNVKHTIEQVVQLLSSLDRKIETANKTNDVEEILHDIEKSIISLKNTVQRDFNIIELDRSELRQLTETLRK